MKYRGCLPEKAEADVAGVLEVNALRADNACDERRGSVRGTRSRTKSCHPMGHERAEQGARDQHALSSASSPTTAAKASEEVHASMKSRFLPRQFLHLGNSEQLVDKSAKGHDSGDGRVSDRSSLIRFIK